MAVLFGTGRITKKLTATGNADFFIRKTGLHEILQSTRA